MMRNTFFPSDQLKKTTSSHFKRYSQHDLKTGSINSLLITQSNAFSNLKFKSLKTKLPQITSSTSSQITANSHGKMNRISDLVGELAGDMEQMNADLQNLRMNLELQKRNVEDRLEKTHGTLGSKVQRLANMLAYAVGQDRKRSEKIQNDCARLRESSETIRSRVESIRSRVKRLEDQLGVYTGEDKYLL